jgi:hypothetical protein
MMMVIPIVGIRGRRRVLWQSPLELQWGRRHWDWHYIGNSFGGLHVGRFPLRPSSFSKDA